MTLETRWIRLLVTPARLVIPPLTFVSSQGSSVDRHPLQALLMEKTEKTLSTAYIHSIYSGSKTTRAIDDKSAFHSTNQFDRDPTHSGQAPENPKPGRKSDRR